MVRSAGVPSPIAHGFIVLAMAQGVVRQHAARPRRVFWVFALLIAVNAADLDFLPGILIGDPERFHHGPTHSLFAAAIFGLIAAGVAPMLGVAAYRFGALMTVAYLSHLALDAWSIDTSPTQGMTILWPFSSAPLQLPVSVFLDIQRDDSHRTFFVSLLVWHNAKAIVREVIIMGVLWAVYRLAMSITYLSAARDDAAGGRAGGE